MDNFVGKFRYKLISFALTWLSFIVFLTEIIIAYFNNKVLEKWANGKAYRIMTSAQFFAIWFIPGSFGKSFTCFRNFSN